MFVCQVPAGLLRQRDLLGFGPDRQLGSSNAAQRQAYFPWYERGTHALVALLNTRLFTYEVRGRSVGADCLLTLIVPLRLSHETQAQRHVCMQRYK